MFEEVEEFNNEVIGIHRTPGTISDPKEFEWCVGVILEELEELKTAHFNGDFVCELDAVIDLLYFTAGFMTRMGIPANISKEIFQTVHNSNMSKCIGLKKERVSSHELDAVKPAGWVSPEPKIYAILNKAFGTEG